MQNSNVFGIDLAKNVFQVCKISKHGEVVFNKSFTRQKLTELLATSKPGVIAIEGCSSCHHWGRLAQQHGHEVRILSPKTVKAFLQGHKTDANDALAIAIAALQASMNLCPVKSIEQQSLQTLTTSRRFLTKECTALVNHIRAFLYEYGITARRNTRVDLREKITLALSDPSSPLPVSLKSTLQMLYDRFQRLITEIKAVESSIKSLASQNEACQRLMSLEGVGSLGACMLMSEIGDGEHFKSGRQASAYMGMTPKQHSSGGKTYMRGINKYGGNKELRSVLFFGALAYISRLPEQPRTTKEAWLMKLIERAGVKRACIALANKTVRTAWALLKSGDAYRSIPV